MTLEIAAVRASYGKTRVLGSTAPVTVAFAPGECSAIVGPNGSAKSTLLRVAAGLHRPDEGRSTLAGRDVRTTPRRELAQEMAFVQQSPTPPPGATVRELVGLGRHPHVGWHGRWRAEDRDAIESAMDRCGVAAFADRVVGTLSGGERQRSWIALAVAQHPKVMLLDEPTSALDLRHQLEVLDLVRTLCVEDGMTAVIVLHDLNSASRFADRIVAMREGQIVADGSPVEVLTGETVARVLGVRAEVRTDGPEGRPLCVPIEPI
ncbi:MAG: ABC transporter ATP-binding protein [Planctomycetota bacterium]